jgi:hypothetical protein
MYTKPKPKLNAGSKIQKKTIVFYCILLLSLLSHGQLTLTSNDFPVPGSEYPYSRKPAPGVEIDSYTNSGADITWDFSTILKTEQTVVRFISPTSTEIQYLCIAVFNNPTDPEHDSDVAKPGEGMSDPMGTIQVTDVFDFYQLTSDAYVCTGRSANVNGLPACIKNNPADTIFSLPFHYGDTVTSYSAFEIEIPGVGYYGQTLHRFSVADAWGTVTTPFGTFNSLRIKSTIEFEDSIFYESYGFGTTFPHTETHYVWLTNDHKIPIFSVEEKGQNFGGTIAFWIDTLDHTSVEFSASESGLNLYPVPATDFLTVELPSETLNSGLFFIMDCSGRVVQQVRLCKKVSYVSVSDLAPGIYLFSNEQKTIQKKFLKN